MINDKQIEEALKNISELKQAINNNLESLKTAFISKDFTKSILISALLFSLSSLLTAISYSSYGIFVNWPTIFKFFVIIFPVIAVIYISIKKIKIINKNPNTSLRVLSKERAFSHLNLNISIVFFSTFALFLILQYRFDKPWLLLPLLVIAYGGCIIITSYSLNIKELSISGFLIILLGLITLLLYKSSLLLWTMIDVSLILFLIYFAVLVSHKKSN